jgi:hypothetical protein
MMYIENIQDSKDIANPVLHSYKNILRDTHTKKWSRLLSEIAVPVYCKQRFSKSPILIKI